ncbi:MULTISPECIES: winged helix-turn-helix transcriptional regulator [Streptomyces]|uniref:winged helix-turn-helix transcriptional regulator n=1 Tax=Streptomyces TaxID=1883 RepID=UPI00167AF4C8|nr:MULTISPECIES: helix-turn-helix domain-containing protein [Streptomyces]MBD3577536.1 helix-turn-helix transcriptional regulator [Streptomyces sp. KD18]
MGAEADEQGLDEYLGGREYAADCQARVAFDVLSNRWDSVIVYILGESGPMRPRALITRIGGISPKVLNEALRRLEYNGLVVRRAYAEAPPRVDYSLTEAGLALLGPIRAMGMWAGRYTEAVLAAQACFAPRESRPHSRRGAVP